MNVVCITLDTFPVVADPALFYDYYFLIEDGTIDIYDVDTGLQVLFVSLLVFLMVIATPTADASPFAEVVGDANGCNF